VVISVCQHKSTTKDGKDRAGKQRYRCRLCGFRFVEQQVKPLGDLRISMDQALTILGMLLEGMSIRAVSRLTGVCKHTICDLIVIAGENCQRFLSRTVTGVPATDVQCDEVWSFIGMKEKQRYRGLHTGDEGHTWAFIAFERNNKLILAHHVGQRDATTCDMFLRKLYNATVGRYQLSTDGHSAYTMSVPYMLHGEVDFAQLIKIFQGGQATGRYSPGKIAQTKKRLVYGDPDPAKVCTSHVERWNLGLRMHVRRFTRLTNAHSKSLRHHKAMLALFIAFYNFCRKHETIKQTPAMAAGLAVAQWSLRELIERAAEV
jgi:IS1 family transposase/transposase-like protein